MTRPIFTKISQSLGLIPLEASPTPEDNLQAVLDAFRASLTDDISASKSSGVASSTVLPFSIEKKSKAQLGDEEGKGMMKWSKRKRRDLNQGRNSGKR